MRYTYNTYEEAASALGTAAMDVAADHGEEMVEAAWGDIVNAIASNCPPEVAEELKRRNS
jgi:hypothetical protein